MRFSFAFAATACGAITLVGCWDFGAFRGDAGVADAAHETALDAEIPDDSSSDGDASELGPCSCFAGDGFFCGARALAGAIESRCEIPLSGVTDDTLVACGDGVWTRRRVCPGACRVAPEDEPADACVLPECDCFVLEAYCGAGAQVVADERDCEIPILPASFDDILHCAGDSWSVKTVCRHGCRQAPDGTPDDCRARFTNRLPFECGREVECTNGNDTATHTGRDRFALDFAVPAGTEVQPMRPGAVLRVRNVSPPGSPCFNAGGPECADRANTVEIRHDDGTIALYMHLEQIFATVGERIRRGQVLGLSGSSGTDTPHLHVQVQTDCGIWHCPSVPFALEEARRVSTGDVLTSLNCD